MANDKPAKRISMKEHIAQNATSEKVGSKDNATNTSELFPVFNEENNHKFVTYNENIKELSDKYTSIIPRFDVLVRAFVNPMKSIGGVLMPNTVPVKAPTKNGVSVVGTMDNPFPYAQKAIVVSVPDSEKDNLSVGDIVYLNEAPVSAKAVGKGDNAVVMIQNKFVHPDNADKYPVEAPIPVDPLSEDYGYLLVKPYDIKVILEKHGN